MNRQAWRDFFITLFFLGIAFIIALLSSIAAERHEGQIAAITAGISLLLALIGAIYIIPRLARNVRLEILRFAIRTTVTVEGLFFVVFLLVIAMAAWNTGNNLLYLILSALLAFLVAANLIARVSLSDISVQLRFPDHIFAGEPARLNITLVNHKRLLPSFSLVVEPLSESSKEENAKTGKLAQQEAAQQSMNEAGVSPVELPTKELGKLAYFMLAPARARARQRIEYTFKRRGRYPITGFRISTKFPAGFFKKWRRIDASGDIIVYPKPQPLDDFYHALPMLAGQIQSHAKGSGDDLYAIRRYHPSDHMRNIDWKATAKSMEMMVREHMREDEWRLTIVFDTVRPAANEKTDRRSTIVGSKDRSSSQNGQQANSAASQSQETRRDAEIKDSFEMRFERAIEMAASLANHFILEQAEVELITAVESQNVSSGSGYEHLYKILRSLATLQPAISLRGAEQNLKEKQRRRWLGFGHSRRDIAAKPESGQSVAAASKPKDAVAWRLLDELPALANERRFKVLITSAAKGTIPANVWRSAHVVFMEDL